MAYVLRLTVVGQGCAPGSIFALSGNSSLQYTELQVLKIALSLCRHRDPCSFIVLLGRRSAHLQSQLNEAATKDELYQYVAQSLRGFVHTVHANTSTQRAMAGEHVCKAASDGRSDTALRSETAPLPREIADAMKAASRRGNVIDFEPLEEAVDR